MSTTNLDLSLLETDMDSVPDLAGFELPPEGSYSALLSITPKVINGVTKLEWNYKVVEPLELNDPEAVVPAEASFSTLAGLADDKQKSFMKVKTTILAEALGIPNNLKAIVENVQNVQVTCFLKHKAHGDKLYANVTDTGFSVG